MDTLPLGISVSDLYRQLGSADSPLVIDVRRDTAFAADNALIASATWRDPLLVNDWAKYLPRHRAIVVYCVHGFEISKNACSALRGMGINARTLEGGIADWKQAGLPLIAKQSELNIPSRPNQPSRWITRERPKIDRIACPWLIRRFIDPLAEFIYVPSAEVLPKAKELNAIAYDIPAVQLSHRGDQCSFDALIEDFAINDVSLSSLAAIVRGADTGKPDLTPQSAGLLAISLGLSVRYSDDHLMLEQGMVMYDALYAWLRSAKGEVHNADLFKKT